MAEWAVKLRYWNKEVRRLTLMNGNNVNQVTVQMNLHQMLEALKRRGHKKVLVCHHS